MIFFFKFFTFFEKFSQVAILKLEHCGLFYLVAYKCLHNSLFFWKWSSKLFLEKNMKNQNFQKFGFWFSKSLRKKHKIFEMRNQKTRFCFGINKLSNAKKRNVLPSKLRPVKTFKVEKKTFQESIWKMTNNWHCLPADRSMVCVFEQHSTSTVESQCATEQLRPY